MKVVWAILCKDTIVNRDTNNMTLVEVIEELNVVASPPQGTPVPELGFSAVLDLHLVSLWVRTEPSVPEKGQARFKAVTPKGREVVTAEAEVDLTEGPRLRADGHLLESPFPFSDDGTYFFKIEMRTPESDWEEVYELPLWVQIQDHRAPEPS